jgi:anthranilate phosphoribosyltransferase
MGYKHALISLTQGKHLALEEVRSVVSQMLAGQCSPAQVAVFFMALRMSGETPEELLGASVAVREHINPKSYEPEQFVCISRTGNDLLGVFDVAIASTFAAAAAGCRLVLHDGRIGASRKIGSQFLEAAGIRSVLTPDQIQECIDKIGAGFSLGASGYGLPANSFEALEQIDVPTLANVLNLVAAPFQAKRYLIGVKDAALLRPVAELFLELGAERLMVVHGVDGLDAISLATETKIVELQDGKIKHYSIIPDDFGVQAKSLTGLLQESAEESLLLIQDALGNRRGHYAEKAADIIILNAGAAIYVSGVADSLRHGVSLAREVVANTKAGEKIRQMALFSQGFKNKS